MHHKTLQGSLFVIKSLPRKHVHTVKAVECLRS